MIILKLIILWILSVLCGLAYHAGGLGRDYSPGILYSRWDRRITCPLLTVLSALMFIDYSAMSISWLALLGLSVLSFGLTLASITTYYKKIFGDKNFWENFTFSGGIAAAGALPFVFVIPWYLILARAIVLAIAWGVLTRIFQSARWSELSRGFSLTLSTIIFAI